MLLAIGSVAEDRAGKAASAAADRLVSRLVSPGRDGRPNWASR